jgi:hypothetical protein
MAERTDSVRHKVTGNQREKSAAAMKKKNAVAGLVKRSERLYICLPK